MCQCDPTIRTPFCGRPGCTWPTVKGTRVSSRIEAVVQETLDRYIGGVPFFDAIDEAWRVRASCIPVVEDFISRVDRVWGFGVISTGRFGLFLHNLMGDSFIGGGHMLIVNGGIRTGHPCNDLSYAKRWITGRNFALLDDSFYSGSTRAGIAKELEKNGGKLTHTFVIYDGSKQKDSAVSSMFRYYDYYQPGNVRKENVVEVVRTLPTGTVKEPSMGCTVPASLADITFNLSQKPVALIDQEENEKNRPPELR